MCCTSSLFSLLLLCSVAAADPLRVCSDPNNLPFSNRAGEGFENRIAELIAKDLGKQVVYTWFPQRRGFVRNTLKANKCDLIMGEPVGFDLAAVTAPFYRSSYVFVTKRGAVVPTGLDDKRLADLEIGIHAIGDDYANVPPARVLAANGFVDHIVGYPLYGDYREPSPPSKLIDAVANGEVDVAIVWGPLAGYFAAKHDLVVTPIVSDAPGMQFAIGLGVRRDDKVRKTAMEHELTKLQPKIDRILADYHVPIAKEKP
jgi:mxaJ protein